MKKIPCNKCGTLILPLTSEKHDGMCVPCARSEKPTAKLLAAVNKLFAPLIRWLNDGKPGGGCLMVPLVVMSLFPPSVAVMKSKRTKNSSAPLVRADPNSSRLTLEASHDKE